MKMFFYFTAHYETATVVCILLYIALKLPLDKACAWNGVHSKRETVMGASSKFSIILRLKTLLKTQFSTIVANAVDSDMIVLFMRTCFRLLLNNNAT